MFKFFYFTIILLLTSVSISGQKKMNIKPLNDQEKKVILLKGTEMPFSGKFNHHEEKGTYTCRQCGAQLYRSEFKFDSGCGWPSFDDEIKGAIKKIPDADGERVEIQCNQCGGHLGHVFIGEHLTDKNTRHCVNSISMDFVADLISKEKAIFAAGCFWGVEYYFKKEPGVISTKVGYTGGKKKNPNYYEVSDGDTGHAEAMEVVYDSKITNYDSLVKLFFEIHDFTQTDGQGPDIGDQYRTEIFYIDEAQKKIAEKYIELLKKKNYKVATKLTKANEFWDAEDYHQKYYDKKRQTPYCHFKKKVFD